MLIKRIFQHYNPSALNSNLWAKSSNIQCVSAHISKFVFSSINTKYLHTKQQKINEYQFCTSSWPYIQVMNKKGYLESFGVSLNIEQYKLLSLLEKISIFLKIIKNSNNSEMQIEQLDKITKMKQVLMKQINQLQIQDQLFYFTYFITAYKLWLYADLTSPYQNKQIQILQLRKLMPAIQTYFTNFQLEKQQIDLNNINTYLVNFECLPPSQHQKILRAMVPYLDKINTKNITIFMVDASYNKFSIPIEFHDRLYSATDIENLQWPYCYYVFLYADCYKKQYSPLINFHFLNRKSRDMFQLTSVSIQELFCFLETLKIQYRLMNQYHLKSFNIYAFYNLQNIQKYIQQKKVPIVDVIKICNQLADIYPIGTRFLRQISLNKDTRYGSQYLLVFKNYIINQMLNLEPHYIYSIEQTCVNEVSLPMLFLLQILIKKVITNDPDFVLQLSNFYMIVGQKIRNSLHTSTSHVLKKINANFSQLTPQVRGQPQNIQKMIKVINFVYNVKENNLIYTFQVQCILKEAKKYIIHSVQQKWQKDLRMLKFIYQTISLVQLENRESFQTLCAKICINYMEVAISKKKQNKQDQDKLKINQSKPHQEYIARILSLMRKTSIFYNNPIAKTLVAEFINTKLAYNIKSIRKQGIIDILLLSEFLPNVNTEIYGLLYNNMSSFVIYSQNNKKFYLPRGPKSYHKQKFVNVLKRAVRNYLTLRKIKQKDRLNILKIMALRFWNELQNIQIAKLLIIFGSPTFLNDKIKKRLKQINFTSQEIQNLEQYEALRPYRFHNTKLFKIFTNKDQYKSKKQMQSHAQIQNYDLTELNFKTQSQIQEIFNNLEFYEEVLQDSRILCEKFIPAPKTYDQKINSIYVCLKVIGKIRDAYDFRLKINNQRPKQSQFKNVIDISDEIRFIKERNLVKLDDLNQFKLGNIQISGNQTMVEGWYAYDAYDNLIEIQEFSNIGQTDQNPYQKILLSLFGDTGFIRQYTRKQSFLSDPVFAALELGFQIQPKGSLIQITNPNNNYDTIFILCSNQSNYKIHTIFAYIFKKIGFDAYICTNTDNRVQIFEFLRNRFNLSQQYIQNTKKSRNSQSQMDDQIRNLTQDKVTHKKIQKLNELSDKSTFMGD